MYKRIQTIFLFVLMMCLTACTEEYPAEVLSEPENNTVPLYCTTATDDYNSTTNEDDDLSKAVSEPVSDNDLDEPLYENSDSADKKLLRSYLECASNSNLNAYLVNGNIAISNETAEQQSEIKISLQNLYGEEPVEMILSFRGLDSKDFSFEIEYYFTFDDNKEPAFMGSSLGGIPDAYYSYGDFCYTVKNGNVKGNDSLNWTVVNKLEFPMEDKVSPDFAQYQNSDALEFIYDTNMYFFRYDSEEWDSENQSWKNPEETAAMFYCEDSDLYEAYSVSKQMLDLTDIDINDYINSDGNHIYSSLPGENYLVSRREYEQIKSKTFEVFTEVTDEPEISSGWINIDDVDKWLDSLT